MALFRNTYLSRYFIVIWCAMFLNLSFFSAEISVLQLRNSKALLANVSKVLSATLAEEETDHSEKPGSSGHAELDLLVQGERHKLHESLTSILQLRALQMIQREHPGHPDTAFRPPEVA